MADCHLHRFMVLVYGLLVTLKANIDYIVIKQFLLSPQSETLLCLEFHRYQS